MIVGTIAFTVFCLVSSHLQNHEANQTKSGLFVIAWDILT